VNLWETTEYEYVAAVERVNLCDYVSVIYEDLGVQATMRVVKTEFDVLLERYNSIELGEVTSTMSTVINNFGSTIQSKSNENTTNAIAIAIQQNNAELTKSLTESLTKTFDDRYVKKDSTS
jgi:phage-related protein